MSDYLPPTGSDAFALLNIISDPGATKERLEQLLELQKTAGEQMDAARQAQVEADKRSKEISDKEKDFNAYVASKTKEIDDLKSSLSNKEMEMNEAHASAKEHLRVVEELRSSKEFDLANKMSGLARREETVTTREQNMAILESEFNKKKTDLENKFNTIKAIIDDVK